MDQFVLGMLTVWLPFSALNLYAKIVTIQTEIYTGTARHTLQYIFEGLLVFVVGPLFALYFIWREYVQN